MTPLQTVEVKFYGEKLATYSHEHGTTTTLYRTPEGLYLVHTDEGEGGTSALDAGRYPGEGFDEASLRWGWPELASEAGL